MTDIQREGESIIDYLYDSATLTSLTRANDTTTSRIYDDLLRPTSLSHDSFTG
ncbi:MAG: hypothetical protein H6766_04175 [Candidatus Peribacteria bacterium]|nr:MAG: hypothetical protein H6766_04175 [Candidatus Peribacteria bacterium]